jgi:hypothetical protein
LLNRLRKHLESRLRRGQNGFRPHRGTLTHAIALQMLAERAKYHNLDLTVVFVDFSNAFPSVHFKALRASLESWLVPTNLIDTIMQCYNNHVVLLDLPSGRVEYTVETGVLQGDTLAPYLFVLLLDSVFDAAINPRLGIPLVPERFGTARTRGTLDLSNDYVTELAFADDVALPARTIRDAEQQLHNFQRVARTVGLEMNFKPGKTEYVVIGKESADESLGMRSLDGIPLKRSTNYQYLGTMPFDQEAAFAKRLSAAWFAIHKLNCIWKNNTIDGIRKGYFMSSLVSSIFSYGGVCWPRTAAWIHKVDVTFKKMLRHCTGYRHSDEVQLYQHGRIPDI